MARKAALLPRNLVFRRLDLWLDLFVLRFEGQIFSRHDDLGGPAVQVTHGCRIVVAECFGIHMAAFPKDTGIDERCLKVSAFENALPANQPDAPRGLRLCLFRWKRLVIVLDIKII